MPVMSPAGVAAAAIGGGMIEQVADGCGRGWWRGPDGRWPLPADARRGVVVAPGIAVVPPVVVVPRRAWCHRPYTSRNFRC